MGSEGELGEIEIYKLMGHGPGVVLYGEKGELGKLEEHSSMILQCSLALLVQ